MRLLLLLSLLLSGCATDSYINHRASVRAQASRRLESCLGWNVCYTPSQAQRNACLVKSNDFCVSHGLEAGCGVDELWTRDYSHCSRR